MLPAVRDSGGPARQVEPGKRVRHLGDVEEPACRHGVVEVLVQHHQPRNQRFTRAVDDLGPGRHLHFLGGAYLLDAAIAQQHGLVQQRGPASTINDFGVGEGHHGRAHLDVFLDLGRELRRGKWAGTGLRLRQSNGRT